MKPKTVASAASERLYTRSERFAASGTRPREEFATMSLPPLLSALFGDSGGYVIYKGYPPHRGDDVEALLKLATILSPAVAFLPHPPYIDRLVDLRRMLRVALAHPSFDSATGGQRDGVATKSNPEDLIELFRWLSQNEPAGAGGASDAARDDGPLGATGRAGQGGESAVAELYGQCRERVDEEFRIVLREAIELAGLPTTTDLFAAVEKSLEQDHPCLAALIRWIILRNWADPATRAAGDAATPSPSNAAAQYIPDDKPLLLIGRPEYLLGYQTATEPGVEPPPLRKLLDDAGYPNRFHFIGNTIGKNGIRAGFRDRKTVATYQQTNCDADDVGFVFLGRTSQGQRVMLAVGSTALGTYAAVDLLTQHRAEFRQAIQRWETAPASSCIDIGFKCRFQRHENRPFPLTTAAQHLDIELINPDDLVGYSWAREGFRKVQPILDVWRAPTPDEGVSVSDGNITWTARPPEKTRGVRVSPVDISVDLAFRVSQEKVLYPGGEMAEVFTRIDAQLQQDLGEWRRKLKGYRTGGPDWKKTYAQMNEDRDFQTFRPILVMGETGTGKQWVAEYLARGWKGRRIDASELDVALAPGPETTDRAAANSGATNHGGVAARKAADRTRAGDRRLSPYDAAERLPAALERFNLDHSPAGGAARPPRDNFYTFSAVSCPVTLLDAALFGIAHHTANDVGAQPGAFLCAGTGVLFLDEMLELPPDQQARLLVALQSGRVRPVGDWREYVYGCRVVVATNRASSEADLRRLEREDKVRSDILARFIQRHTLPPLRRRTLEIIPALGLLLRQERLQRGVDSATPLYIRLSRLACESLVMNSFAANLRDLRQLSESLPLGLVNSFLKSLAESPAHDPRQTCIRLTHLRQLAGIQAASGDGLRSDEGDEQDEAEIFEFRFDMTPPKQTVDPAERLEFLFDLDDRDPTADLLSGERRSPGPARTVAHAVAVPAAASASHATGAAHAIAVSPATVAALAPADDSLSPDARPSPSDSGPVPNSTESLATLLQRHAQALLTIRRAVEKSVGETAANAARSGREVGLDFSSWSTASHGDECETTLRSLAAGLAELPENSLNETNIRANLKTLDDDLKRCLPLFGFKPLLNGMHTKSARERFRDDLRTRVLDKLSLKVRLPVHALLDVLMGKHWTT